jgi:Na+/phosphate symporter
MQYMTLLDAAIKSYADQIEPLIEKMANEIFNDTANQFSKSPDGGINLPPLMKEMIDNTRLALLSLGKKELDLMEDIIESLQNIENIRLFQEYNKERKRKPGRPKKQTKIDKNQTKLTNFNFYN